MTTLTEGLHAAEFILSEANFHRSRDAITVSLSAVLGAGTVLGRLGTGAALSAASAAKAGGNTGNGALTLDGTTPVLNGAKVGVYTVRCIAAATNSGTFRVEDPNGVVKGDVAVGATFSDEIKFAIADGSSDFIVGDGFDITVTAGGNKGEYKKLNLTGTDGSQIASAVLYADVDASAADAAGVGLVRACEVKKDSLVWPSGITTDQKNAAIVDLSNVGIIVR